jgi:NDP-sugar pyrophosphorylase family protein
VNSVPAPNGNCLAAIDVFVLAGGLGTRIRPILGDTPKLLAPIRGGTYVDHLLNWLRHFGARRVVLGLGVHARAIIDYVQAHPVTGMEIETVIEPSPLGTAGAIRNARATMRSDPVLVINGDSFADTDLCRLLERHRAANASATMLCAELEDAGRYGRLALDSEGFVERFVEKDSSRRGKAWINAGIYLISTQLLDLIASGPATSLERDVFERLPRRSLAAYTECSRFIDIGTPESLAQADEVFGALLGAQHNR